MKSNRKLKTVLHAVGRARHRVNGKRLPFRLTRNIRARVYFIKRRREMLRTLNVIFIDWSKRDILFNKH